MPSGNLTTRAEAAEEVRVRLEGERERALRAQAERLERKNKQVCFAVALS